MLGERLLRVSLEHVILKAATESKDEDKDKGEGEDMLSSLPSCSWPTIYKLQVFKHMNVLTYSSLKLYRDVLLRVRVLY